MPPKYQKKTYRRKRPMRKRRPARKKAYKPRVKRATIKQIMPMAEGRKRAWNNFDTSYLAEEWRVQVPNSWEVCAREAAYENTNYQNTSNGFTGNTLFCRYINEHVKIGFETIKLNPQPVVMTVMHGWCKAPYQQPLLAEGNAARINANGVSYVWNLQTFIKQKLSEVFSGPMPVNDPKVFKLNFRKEYYIGGRTISTTVPNPDPTKAPIAQEQTFRKEIDFYPKWTPMRKYHMIPVQFGTSTTVKPDDFNFTDYTADGSAYWTPSPNKNGELWYPFFAIRFKNVSEFGVDQSGSVDITKYPKIISKNTTYFLDL